MTHKVLINFLNDLDIGCSLEFKKGFVKYVPIGMANILDSMLNFLPSLMSTTKTLKYHFQLSSLYNIYSITVFISTAP